MKSCRSTTSSCWTGLQLLVLGILGTIQAFTVPSRDVRRVVGVVARNLVLPGASHATQLWESVANDAPTDKLSPSGENDVGELGESTKKLSTR